MLTCCSYDGWYLATSRRLHLPSCQPSGTALELLVSAWLLSTLFAL